MMNRFSQKVLEITKRIPAGKVSTYSGIAKATGSPNAFRAVGSALGKNKALITIHCHRIVMSKFPRADIQEKTTSLDSCTAKA
jgi:O-6-methylguanine DNA methyltransferase